MLPLPLLSIFEALFSAEDLMILQTKENWKGLLPYNTGRDSFFLFSSVFSSVSQETGWGPEKICSLDF